MSAGLPGARRPIPRNPEYAGRNRRCGIGCALERDAELDEVPDRLDHRQRAAREHAVVPADDAVADVDPDVAECVLAVPEPRAGDRIGHEREASGRDPPEQAHRVGIEMDAVHDHLEHDVRAHEGCTDDAGITMRERAHRVEDVRDGANPPVERRCRLGSRRVAVAERDRDAARLQEVDQPQRTGELGCQCQESHRACPEQAVE